MNKGAASQADKGENVDLTVAIKWLNAAVINNIGHALREPEIVILKGTWRGVTYEQMSHGSEYSTNYLMRDVAPKLWKQLSNVFGHSVGKTNFRVALEAYVTANANVEQEFAAYELSNPSGGEGLSDFSAADLAERSPSDPGFYWHPAFASDPRTDAVGTDAADTAGAASRRSNAPLLAKINQVPVSLPAVVYGYADELAQVKQWLTAAVIGVEGHGRLVGIWGLSGVGKTLLAETVAYQLSDRFDAVICRSLQDQPSLEDLCSGVLMGLGVIPQGKQLAAQLLTVMAQRPLLLVLEGIEAILNPGCLAGEYKANYQAYGDFFKSAAGLRSCVVVTGIEGPAELTRQGVDDSQRPRGTVRSLTLTHLSEVAATELLRAEALNAPEHWPALIERYQGHPLALKAAARIVRDFFEGNVDTFLQQTSVLFTDISRLLAASFNRLSPSERTLLYWLASQDMPRSLAELQSTVALSLKSVSLISVLDSLKVRSLLETKPRPEEALAFSLPPLVKAYVGHQLIAQLSKGTQEIPTAFNQRPEPVINLGSSSAAGPIPLDQWLKGCADNGWHTLDRLFCSVSHPAMRFRTLYPLCDDAFAKRCKPIYLDKSTSEHSALASSPVFLLVAIRQDDENLYRVCVQVQPATDATVLPESLTLELRDSQYVALATVSAQLEDSFIQLPDFKGALLESFELELTLGAHRHTESFII